MSANFERPPHFEGEFLTVREGYREFVTRAEHADAMRGLREDLREVKTDTKAIAKNQLPPWALPIILAIIGTIATLAMHFWK